MGAAGGVFGSLLAPRDGSGLGGLATTAAGRQLRFGPARTLRAMSFQADQAAGPPDPGVVAVPIVVVNGARVPWGKVVVRADQW